MTKAYRVTVSAPKETGGVLDIIQVLDLVRDFFRILNGGDRDVLLDVRTVFRENPLTVECVPYSKKTQEVDYASVEKNASDFVCLCDAILSESPSFPDVSQPILNGAKRLLKNISEHDYHTDYNLGPIHRSIAIERGTARCAVQALERLTATRYSYLSGENSIAREFGEVDGKIVEISKHRGVPALLINDLAWKRKIWCTLADSEIHEWEEKLTAADAWGGKRVRICGELILDKNDLRLKEVKDGRLSVVNVPDADISLDDLFDPDFTGGLSTKEFLRRRWEGADSSFS